MAYSDYDLELLNNLQILDQQLFDYAALNWCSDNKLADCVCELLTDRKKLLLQIGENAYVRYRLHLKEV